MRKISVYLSVLVVLGFGWQNAFAQDAADTTYNQRAQLAKQMHELRPIEKQVNATIANVAAVKYPVGQSRDNFAEALRRGINYKAINKISIDAMVEVYTIEELGAMVAYYSNPVAVSATDKNGEWARKVSPEIGKMLDKAIMNLRTER